MSKCPLNNESLLEIRDLTSHLQKKAARERWDVNSLKSHFNDFVKKIINDIQIGDSNAINSIADVIFKEISRSKRVFALDPDYLSINNIKNLLDETRLGVLDIDRKSTSIDKIEDLPQKRMQASTSFLEKAYAQATSVANVLCKLTDLNLFDCLFINRGSVNNDLGIVRTTSQLNSNIRDYQEQLLLRILNYLKEDTGLDKRAPEEVKTLLENPRMYNLGKYTRALDILSPYINSYLKPLQGQTDLLRLLFKNRLTDPSSKRRLEAFNAMIILNNFDSYLINMLGKSILIKDFGLFTGEDKYIIADKTANVFTTWRTTENINVESEADNITKLAVNTTPLLRWNNNTPSDGKFLRFQDFQHIISKIKDLVYKPEVSSIIFDNNFISNNSDLWNSLSEETKAYLKEKSLRAAIAMLRENPRAYLHSIFEILANDTFKEMYPSLYENFYSDELNKLYSISQGIFNGNNSLRNLTDSHCNNDFYAYLTQTADSIFNVLYSQYYRDENGIIKNRTLLDQGVNNVKRAIEQSINIANSYRLIGDWKTYAEPYNFLEKISDINGTILSLSFNIPNTNIKTTISSTGIVKMTKNGSRFDYKNSYDELKPFIDNILRLNLGNNPSLEEVIREEFSNNMEVDLASFAAKVVFNQYVNQKYLLNISPDSRDRIIQTIYQNGAPSWNYTLDELGLIHPKDLNTLRGIAIAKSNLQGLTTSTQVKDSEGKAQSRQTLSRLLGSFTSQFELQERLPNSISNHFLLLNNPGLLEGVYTVKEFAGDNTDSKAFTDMSVSEMTYSQFIFDYIGGLMKQSEGSLVGDGHIMLLPSVNSDKNTIGRIKINLNNKITINGTEKALKDLNTGELEEVINKEFGLFYEKMVFKILNDWDVLQSFIGIEGMPRLSQSFISNFAEFNLWFNQHTSDILLWLVERGFSVEKFTPINFIKTVCTEYNKLNRLHPLELIDLVHYKKGSLNTLATNETILAQVARFNPNSSIFFGKENIKEKYPTNSLFWVNKKSEVLKSLLSSKITLNTSDTKQPELAYLRKLNQNEVSKGNSSWINSSGNVILSKVNYNGNWIGISSQRDFIKLGITNYHDWINKNKTEIILNPLIEKYNYLDYLFTQEFMNMTVGSFVAHPDKSKSLDIIEQESGLFLAQHKRNVSMTAAMHEFQLNMLNGIPSTYNLAVIEDIHDLQGTITGLLNDIKPFDGATFVNPFVVLLENNSLCGAKAGITKKQFVHFKNETTGTGGIIKTAGFGLTNDWIRNSKFLQRMMKKMTDHVWLNQDGSEAHVDITKNYYGNRITNYENIYFKKNGKYYRIVDLNYIGNNQYNYNLLEVSQSGDFIQYVAAPNGNKHISDVINSNYKLWNFFGGALSMELKNGKLVPSNTSVTNVVVAMNNTKSEETKVTGRIETQKDLWQPLKMVDVHYLATAGAVKQGGANINSAGKYTDDEAYDIQKIHMYQAGIQLDKEHHADDAELSLMTLVVSACAAKGYTFEECVKLYDALAKASKAKVGDHIKAVEDLFDANTSEKKAALREVLIKSIIKVLSTSNSNNFAVKLAKDLEEQAKQGKEIKYSEQLLPLSDNNIHAKVLGAITSYLSKVGIKLKIPGSLSVLTPSFGIMKLYNGKKYEAYENPKEELEALLKQQVPVYSSRFKYHKNDTNFMGMNIVYVAPNSLISELDGLPVAARNDHGTILLDLNLLGLKYRDKAWRNVRNSRALGQDFNTLEDWVNFVLLHEAMHNEYKIAEGESRFDYESRINDEALKRFNSSIINLELGRTYLVTRSYDVEVPNDDGTFTLVSRTDTIPELIRTPSEYIKLKRDIENGVVVEVTEDIREGRDLAGYNVRFETDKGKFLIWDLDSASCLFEINELEKYWSGVEGDLSILLDLYNRYYPRAKELNITITEKNGEHFLELLKKYQRRILQRDLANLSKDEPNVLEQFQVLLNSKPTVVTLDWYNRFASWVNIKLGVPYGNLILLRDGNKVKVTGQNFNEIVPYVLDLLEKLTKVRIQGEYHKVNKDSIKTQAYEVIMPKTFATVFGLSEFDSLEEIEKNPNYFVEQYIKNQASKVSLNQYSIEFKRSTGKHLYVLHTSLLVGSGLHKLEGVLIETEDGVTTRLDSMQQPMYELSPNSEIYVDNLGNEVIVSDDIDFYTNNLTYDSIQISQNINTEILRSLPELFVNSSNKVAQKFGKHLKSYKETEILQGSIDWNEVSTSSPIIRQMHEKHTSFLRSLDIVAARIPAQSMQSYMPMRIVAFDNPDINTAYVSTYQILLLGSDYDVDCVSLATFDIDQNGMYLLWSPYADISDIDNLHTSELLPTPTGVETEIKETDDISKALKIFQPKYQELLKIRYNLKYNVETKEYVIDPTAIVVGIDANIPESIKLLGEFLQEDLYKINLNRINEFVLKFNELNEVLIKDMNDVLSILSLIKKIVDKHNLYFNKINQSKLNRIINNRTILSMYSTINNPVNLMQALMSVDKTTGPLKEVAENDGAPEIILEAKCRTAGNFVNKCESIRDNQVGKKGIGVCATGLKAFFALTQYNNYVLNHGTAEEQQKLLLHGKEGIYIDSEHVYKTLANIRSLDPNTITNDTVLDALSRTTNDEDAALILSALLSLATDNAKELALSKLNAGTKTLGMYIYGVAIGIDFHDIAKLLMSNIGLKISEIAESDVFKQTDGYNAIKSAFDYFETLPNKYLGKYDVHKNPSGNTIESPLEFFTKQIRKLEDAFYFEDSDGREVPLNVVLTNFAKSNRFLTNKLEILESLKGLYKNNAYGSEVYNQLIDFLEDYIIDLDAIVTDTTGTFLKLKTLAYGADEMKTLGQILGVNGGIKTDYEGLINQINRIERVISNLTNRFEDIIDLTKFVFDENYRQECIEKYELVKHTFNILDCLVKVPHFFQYITDLATAQKEAMQSYKFRSVKNTVSEIADRIGWHNEGKIAKGLLNYIGDKMRNDWMLDNDIVINIPSGVRAFDRNGNDSVLTETKPIKLGTDWGNATFRIFMETKVIPDLKNGIITPKGTLNSIKENKFILDLTPDLFTKTASSNPTILYTLPINMLPRTEVEQGLLDSYIALFNELASKSYEYNITKYNEDGTEYTEIASVPLLDLFVYYSMIAHNWKLGENSLVPILEHFLDTGVIKDFHNYEAALDNSDEVLNMDNFEEIKPYVIPRMSPYSAYSRYIKAKNPSSRKIEIMEKSARSNSMDPEMLGDMGIEDFETTDINGYQFISPNVDTNYFTSGVIGSTDRLIKSVINDNNGTLMNLEIQYDAETNTIKRISINNEMQDIKSLKTMLFRKEDGKKIPRLSEMKSIIKNELYPCHV